MKYRLLGKSGLRVSELALGTMSFGNMGDLAVDEQECRKIFDAYAEAGGNFIDTADCYMGGQSEERVWRFVVFGKTGGALENAR